MKKHVFVNDLSWSQLRGWILFLFMSIPMSLWGENWIDTANTNWYDGHESETRFLISSPEELAGIATLVNDGNTLSGKIISLENDIDLSGKYWTPIGSIMTGADDGMINSISFNGVFDGNNHSVSGITINTGGASGLFGCIIDSEIRNISVGGEIRVEKGFSDLIDNVGGLVGSCSQGNVVNCNSNVNIYVGDESSHIGGVVGVTIMGTIENCSYTGMATGGTVGGIVGAAFAGKIESCCNKGTIKSGGVIGGIAGTVSMGQVLQCYNVADILLDEALRVGGIVGDAEGGAEGDCLISECYNSGKIIASALYCAGVVASISGFSPVDQKYKASVVDCYNTGSITNNKEVAGGIAGTCIASISRCYNIGPIVGDVDSAGGVIAMHWGEADTCYFLEGSADSGIGTGNEGGVEPMGKSLMTSFAEVKGSLIGLLNSSSDVWSIASSKNNGYPYLTVVPVEGSSEPPTDNELIGNDLESVMYVKDNQLVISLSQSFYVQVININGHVIFGKQLNSGENCINNLPTGIYIVHLANGYSQKIYIK